MQNVFIYTGKDRFSLGMFNINFGAGMVNRAGRIQAVKPEKNIMKMQQLDRDCFIKRPSFGLEFSPEEKAQRLFFETYNEVIQDAGYSNPAVLNLRLFRPSMKLSDINSKSTAAYDFADNEIKLSNHYNDDVYLLFSKDDSGALIRYGKASSANLDEKIKKAHIKSNGRKIEVLKLTEAEKEFKLKADTAHELRHFIQQHFISSTEGAMDIQRQKYENVFGKAQEVQDNYLKICAQEGIAPDKGLTAAKIPDYWQRYTPKTILNADAKMKFASDKKDKRFWSIQKDMLLSAEKPVMQSGYTIPAEIDAYNYEAEYITKYAKVYNVRPETAQYLAQEAEYKSRKGIEYMKKSGYDFLQESK